MHGSEIAIGRRERRVEALLVADHSGPVSDRYVMSLVGCGVIGLAHLKIQHDAEAGRGRLAAWRTLSHGQVRRSQGKDECRNEYRCVISHGNPPGATLHPAASPMGHTLLLP